MVHSSAEKDIHLIDEYAKAWLAQRGYRVRSHLRPLHLFANEVSCGTFVLRRMWSSGFTANWRLVDSEEVVSVTLLLDGDLTAETEDGTFPLQMGSTWAWMGSRDVVWSGRSAAVIQIEVDWARLPGFLDLARIEGRPFVASRSLRDPFVALVMSVLDSEMSPSHSSFMQIQRALEAMTSAILVEEAGLPAYRGRSVTGRALFQRATAFIASNAGDPALTLDSIAEALNVSTPHLIRVFQSSETTPIRYLRNIRAMNAMSMLESSTQINDIEEIARRPASPAPGTCVAPSTSSPGVLCPLRMLSSPWAWG